MGALTSLMVSLHGLLMWQTRRTYPGFGRWTLGNLSLSLGLLFLCARGVVPDGVSVAGTNAGTFLAVLLFLEGTREFRGLPPRYWPATVLAGCSMLAQLYFLVGGNHVAARIVVASVCLGILELAMAATLLKGVLRCRKLPYWFTGSLFLANGIFNLTRGLVTCFRWGEVDLFASTLGTQVYFVGMVVTVLGWAFGFTMLTKDRLIDDLIDAQRRALDADTAKTEFLAHISHEIRTPLVGVIGLISLMVEGQLGEESRPDLQTARQSAEGLLEVVNQVLDLSKIEAGQMSLHVAPFDLSATLTRVVKLFEPQAAAKSTMLRLTYPWDAPLWFAGDEMRVRQIVSNFTSNAVKFTEGGTIDLGVALSPGRIKLWVRDTGAGMDPVILPRLFSKFSQANGSTAHHHGGTGLGLAISKQLAELMAGSVGVTSELGRGSTFWAELPLAPVEPTPMVAPRRDPARAALDGLRVLVVDDNITNRYFLVKLLESRGAVVDVACSGQEALLRYQQAEHAVVLMDCRMPEMDGYETARRIRRYEDGSGRHTPIIAATANAMPDERDRCRAAGMDDYLLKPIEPAVLFERIAKHISPTTRNRFSANRGGIARPPTTVRTPDARQ